MKIEWESECFELITQEMAKEILGDNFNALMNPYYMHFDMDDNVTRKMLIGFSYPLDPGCTSPVLTLFMERRNSGA